MRFDQTYDSVCWLLNNSKRDVHHLKKMNVCELSVKLIILLGLPGSKLTNNHDFAAPHIWTFIMVVNAT